MTQWGHRHNAPSPYSDTPQDGACVCTAAESAFHVLPSWAISPLPKSRVRLLGAMSEVLGVSCCIPPPDPRDTSRTSPESRTAVTNRLGVTIYAQGIIEDTNKKTLSPPPPAYAISSQRFDTADIDLRRPLLRQISTIVLICPQLSAKTPSEWCNWGGGI